MGRVDYRLRERSSSKMRGASGKKLPYQRLELRPLRMWMGSIRARALEVEAEGAGSSRTRRG